MRALQVELDIARPGPLPNPVGCRKIVLDDLGRIAGGIGRERTARRGRSGRVEAAVGIENGGIVLCLGQRAEVHIDVEDREVAREIARLLAENATRPGAHHVRADLTEGEGIAAEVARRGVLVVDGRHGLAAVGPCDAEGDALERVVVDPVLAIHLATLDLVGDVLALDTDIMRAEVVIGRLVQTTPAGQRDIEVRQCPIAGREGRRGSRDARNHEAVASARAVGGLAVIAVEDQLQLVHRPPVDPATDLICLALPGLIGRKNLGHQILHAEAGDDIVPIHTDRSGIPTQRAVVT